MRKPDTHYSFPVVTGIAADDPLSTRAARMKIYERFTTELDGSGEKISQELSEVDLSNPEDVKALIPDQVDGDSGALWRRRFSGPVSRDSGASAGVEGAVSEAVVGGYAV